MPYFQPKLTLPTTLSFANKTILITGSSAGLGLAAVRHLVLHGAQEIICGVRSPNKALAANKTILADPEVKTANPSVKLTVLQVDAEDYESVLRFAKEVKTRYEGGLDMVLLNAATGSLRWEVAAKTGHEKIVQVNVLSPALLALELLPLLEKAAARNGVPSRLSWVGSFVQFDHSLQKKPVGADGRVLAHFDKEENFVSMARYSDSKLLGTMFVEQLAAFVDPAKVIVNDVSPGMCKTGFGEYPAWLRIMFGIIFGLRARNADSGAQTYLYALGVAGKESHGKYLSDNLVAQRAPFTETEAGKTVRANMWDEMWREFSNLDGTLQRLS